MNFPLQSGAIKGSKRMESAKKEVMFALRQVKLEVSTLTAIKQIPEIKFFCCNKNLDATKDNKEGQSRETRVGRGLFF